jgi:hypothetical protein
VDLGDELFDLAFALVPSLVEQFDVVVRRQMRREQADRGQGEVASGQQVQDPGKPPRRPRRLDTAVGGVLGEVQHLRAVREERRAAFAEVQAPRVDLRQRRDELHRRLPLAAGESFDLREQFLIRQLRERAHDRRHRSLYHRRFHLAGWPPARRSTTNMTSASA